MKKLAPLVVQRLRPLLLNLEMPYREIGLRHIIETLSFVSILHRVHIILYIQHRHVKMLLTLIVTAYLWVKYAH